MNLLPSMLIATTLIGGIGNIQANTSCTDLNALQDQLKDKCINGQIIIGNASDMESILGELGINIDSIIDCIKPPVPDTDIPNCNTPDSNCPDNNTPEAGAPDNGTDLPGTDVPGSGTSTPDVSLPGGDANTPDGNLPGNSGSDTEQDAEKSYVERVVELVNIERAKVNLPALIMSEDLNKAAYIRAKETLQSFSHTRPNGSSFSTVLKENGISYRGAGENIAWGQRTPEAVVNAWMNSEGHRANILNKNFTFIGVGYYLDGATPYWTQLFTY